MQRNRNGRCLHSPPTAKSRFMDSLNSDSLPVPMLFHRLALLRLGLALQIGWVLCWAGVIGFPVEAMAETETAAALVDASSSHFGPLSEDAKPQEHNAWPGQPGSIVAPRFAADVDSRTQAASTPECPPESDQGACPAGPRRRRLRDFIQDPNRAGAFQSWLYRPMSLGIFLGGLGGVTLVDDWVDQDTTVIGGVRLGWDFDDYWGAEARYAVAAPELNDSDLAIQASPQYSNPRHSTHMLLDASILYYPWGDTRWRPYVLFGVGMGQVGFNDRLGVQYSSSAFSMPVGLGVKYQHTDRLALRLEFNDTVVFAGGSGMNTVNDFSITGGLELRFGGSRRSYWPWNPGASVW